MKNNTFAIVLVSGGMDSCVSAASAIEDGYQPAFLHVNYRQLTEKRELLAFHKIGDYYDVKERIVIDLIHLATIGGSCLTDKSVI